MPRASDIYTPEEGDYLSEDAKVELAKTAREFLLKDVQAGEGEYGAVWDLEVVFPDTGEIKHFFMGGSEARDQKMVAFGTYLAQPKSEPIGPMIYQRGKTKAGKTWSDITDA
jgi:hypothetical protein